MKTTLNRKGIMAFENMDEVISAPEAEVQIHDPEALVENELMELGELDTSIAADGESIEEAVEVTDAIDNISAQMQVSVDQEDGITPPVAEALRVAVEHFHRRLGYAGKHVFPAMEDFGGKLTKKAATELAIKQNNAMVAAARGAINVAQEGMIDKIKNKWALIWTNEKKLLKRLDEVSLAYDNGAVKAEDIIQPGWGKGLNTDGKSKVEAKDVLADLMRLQTQFDSDKLATVLVSAADALDGITASLAKSHFIANDDAVEKIKKLHGEIFKLAESAEDEFTPKSGKGTDADFAPVQAADKKKMVAALNSILTNVKLPEALLKFEQSLSAAWSSNFDQAYKRLAGEGADDVKAAEKAIDDASDLYEKVSIIESKQVFLSHHAISYIADSIGKKN